LYCQDAKGQRSRGKHQHECGGSDAFDIAGTQMEPDGCHEIEDQTDSRGDSDWRPPDSKHDSHCPGKLARGQQRKVLKWDPDSFVEHFDLKRIAPDFADAGI
jgi:hypothetical protein